MNTAPLKIMLVDDEAPARKRLRELLSDCAAEFNLEIVEESRNGIVALAALDKAKPDVILLDIRMPEMDGIEFAQHVQKLPEPPAIIFTTAYDNYAIQAFEVNAIDYLLKPIRVERLAAALKKAHALSAASLQALQNLSPRAPANLSVVERGKIQLIPINEIIYLKAELKYVTIKTSEREYLLEESLTRLEQEYALRFVRIHRNCLVAKEYIIGLEKVEGGTENAESQSGWVVLLKGLDEKLAISRRQLHLVKEIKN